MKTILISLIFLVGTVAVGQTTTQDGDWITGATWGGSSPGYTGLNTPTVINDVESASGLTFANANGRSLTIGAGGVLVVRGDIIFDITKNNAAITVGAGGIFIVFGSVELGKNNAGINVEAGGVVVVTEAITADGNNGTISGDGKVYSPSTDLDDTGIGEGMVQPIDNLGGPGEDGYDDIEDFVTGGGTDPLPVELVYFKAENNGNSTLKWSTATEINNDHFVIERSEDGEYFYEIGKVQGNGTSNEVINYSFEDKFVLAPVEYYRLLQVDYDGQKEYFSAVRVETDVLEAKKQWSVYPTTVTNQKLTVKSNGPFELKEITIFDISGGFKSNLINSIEKENTISYSIDLGSFKSGFYIIRTESTAGEIFSSRIFIR